MGEGEKVEGEGGGGRHYRFQTGGQALRRGSRWNQLRTTPTGKKNKGGFELQICCDWGRIDVTYMQYDGIAYAETDGGKL